MPEYDAVLFDNDGVLVEPPADETQREAVRAAFRSVGVDEPTPADILALAGGVTVERLREVAAGHGVDPERLWTARERHDERSQFEAFEAGARSRYGDVTAVTDLAVDAAVVSNNHHTTVEFVLEFFGLADAFDAYYGREMTVESLRRKKPDPHYIERALEDLGAGAALYVGDSETDVVAAHRAGLESAFVRRPHSRDAELTSEPTHEVETLAGLGELLEG